MSRRFNAFQPRFRLFGTSNSLYSNNLHRRSTKLRKKCKTMSYSVALMKHSSMAGIRLQYFFSSELGHSCPNECRFGTNNCVRHNSLAGGTGDADKSVRAPVWSAFSFQLEILDLCSQLAFEPDLVCDHSLPVLFHLLEFRFLLVRF